jgi:hypothetical protein
MLIKTKPIPFMPDSVIPNSKGIYIRVSYLITAANLEPKVPPPRKRVLGYETLNTKNNLLIFRLNYYFFEFGIAVPDWDYLRFFLFSN